MECHMYFCCGYYFYEFLLDLNIFSMRVMLPTY